MQPSKANRLPKAELSQGALRRLEKRYHLLKSQLQHLGWIAQGSVCPQPPHAWRLTRKVKAKTISLALSAEQAELYKKAILNNRRLEATLRKMREISEEVLQKSVPGVQRRPRQKLP